MLIDVTIIRTHRLQS